MLMTPLTKFYNDKGLYEFLHTDLLKQYKSLMKDKDLPFEDKYLLYSTNAPYLFTDEPTLTSPFEGYNAFMLDMCSGSPDRYCSYSVVDLLDILDKDLDYCIKNKQPLDRYVYKGKSYDEAKEILVKLKKQAIKLPYDNFIYDW